MKLSLLRAAMNDPRLNPRNIKFSPQVPYKVQAAYGIFAVVVFGSLGEYVQKQEVNRMTRFRDKTALYGSEKGPDDEPSWGCKEKDFKWNFSQWPRSWWY